MLTSRCTSSVWILITSLLVPCLSRTLRIRDGLQTYDNQTAASLEVRTRGTPVGDYGSQGGGLPYDVLDDNFYRTEEDREEEQKSEAASQQPSFSWASSTVNDPDQIGSDVGDLGDFESLEDEEQETAAAAITQPWRPPNQSRWQRGTGLQWPLKFLTTSSHDGLWEEALETGKKLKNELDTQIQLRTNKARYTTKVGNAYEVFVRENVDVDDIFKQIGWHFYSSGIGRQGDVKFFGLSSDLFTIRSRVQQQPGSTRPGTILRWALELPSGAVIVLEAFADEDKNAAQSRLRSSELLWQSWNGYLGETKKVEPRKMKYIFRHHVINQQSLNILTLAHMRNPASIDRISNGQDGQPLPPTTGHGTWRPDPDGSSTPEGQVYLRLLSTPNVKSIVHMLADHVQDMDNNYITEIHTFPQILSRQNVNVATERMAHIILVLGPKPGQSDQPVGTVQTA